MGNVAQGGFRTSLYLTKPKSRATHRLIRSPEERVFSFLRGVEAGIGDGAGSGKAGKAARTVCGADRGVMRD
ncbi:hypothetical protein SRHO_G00073000 [Serrasalmus rhombeus]